MMTLATPTAEELAVAFDASDDDDVVHWIRPCDSETALCGESLAADDECEHDTDETGPPCPECVAIDRVGDTEHLAGCAVCREAEES